MRIGSFLQCGRHPVGWYARLLLLLVCILNFVQVEQSSFARADAIQPLRADNYELDIQGGRVNESPKIAALWATGSYLNAPFRVKVPHQFFAAKKLLVHYQWASGTLWAGQSERVEMYWRKAGQQAWRVTALGQGFREPSSGQLLLFPFQIDLSEADVGRIEMKFLIQLQSGETIWDGGERALLSFYVAPRSLQNVLSFSADWSNCLTGRLVPGRAFDLQYDAERLVRQMSLQTNEPSPWSLVAHVRFDDGPSEEYPLVVLVSGLSTQVVSFVPTVVIPENAKRMSIWFLAFHNSRSYFDSNFGMNFNFDIPSSGS